MKVYRVVLCGIVLLFVGSSQIMLLAKVLEHPGPNIKYIGVHQYKHGEETYWCKQIEVEDAEGVDRVEFGRKTNVAGIFSNPLESSSGLTLQGPSWKGDDIGFFWGYNAHPKKITLEICYWDPKKTMKFCLDARDKDGWWNSNTPTEKPRGLFCREQIAVPALTQLGIFVTLLLITGAGVYFLQRRRKIIHI